MFSRRKSVRSFERLETRAMLAGHVTATLNAGDLTITGDDAANILRMQEVSGGGWEIVGVNTKVNGHTKITTEPVTGQIIVNLNGGNDRLTIHGGNISEGALFNLGAGNNALNMWSMTYNFGFDVIGGDGKDTVAISNVNVTDPAQDHYSQIDTNGGNDLVSINHLNVGNIEFSLGAGNDTLKMQNSTFFQQLNVDAGDGKDTVNLKAITTDPLTVEMGPGKSDHLSITGSDANTVHLLDTEGTNGFVSGANNIFGTQTISPNFTHRKGDLKVDVV